MTTKNTGKDQELSAKPATLAEVRHRILDDPALPLGQRRDIASSLNTLGKAVGKMLEAVPAHPTALRAMLQRKTAAMVGISRGRWNNVRSHTGLALLHLGVVTIPNRIDAAPSAAWQALLDRVTDKGRSAVLGRFARCCTRQLTEPSQVDEAFMASHGYDLIHRSLISQPETHFRETVLAWNSAVSNVEGWPGTRLTVPDNSLYYTPAWSSYPASLTADVEVWLTGGEGGDLFSRLPSRRTLRPATVQSNRVHLRLMLGALVIAGEDPALLVDLRAVITPERVLKACTWHLERAGDERSYVNARIASLAVTIATHHLKLSGDSLTSLREIAQRLRMPKRGMTERNKERLRVLDDSGRTDALVNLPWRMAAEVDQEIRRTGTSTFVLALKYQTALALGLALTKCWRIKNLGSLTIGKNLLLRPDGRVVAVFHRTEVKNNSPIETALMPELGKMVHTYLKVHRPMLADAPSDFLFPGKGTGRPKTLGALSQNIKAALAERVGVDATTHFFRHLSGKLILDDDPTAIRTVQEHLGHNTLETTLSYYVDRRGTAATAHYDALIERRMAESKDRRVSRGRISPKARTKKGRK